jgi:hypothetical protein
LTSLRTNLNAGIVKGRVGACWCGKVDVCVRGEYVVRVGSLWQEPPLEFQ